MFKQDVLFGPFKTNLNDKLCKRRTDIPAEWEWSAGEHRCEKHTVWEGEWRWVSYRAYSVNLCSKIDEVNCYLKLMSHF